MSSWVRILGAKGSKKITTWLYICACLVIAQPAAGNAAGLPEIVEQLVLAYNTQDETANRHVFSKKLKSEYSQDRIKEILRINMNGQGKIVSHKVDLSPDGRRARL